MSANNGRPVRRRVVVTGMGAVSPNGIGIDEFWQASRNGKSGIDTIESFDPEFLSCRIAAEVKRFRPENYLPPKDLKRMGRAVPFAIAATQEAFRAARLSPQDFNLQEKQSWGVILGSGGGASDFTEEQYRLYFNDQLRKVSAYNVSSSTAGTVSSEISLYFDMHGPSHMISTGCTSATDAIGYAFNMIRFGLADHLITGGVDATITPGIMQGFCVMRAVSTLHNDKTETLAVKLCFGQRAYETPMSSIKSMIGHPQGASGAAGMAAAILGMEHGFLPPTINYENSDPECDLNYIPNHGIAKAVDVSLCNCIGFGSKNS